jgi:hypothetical protein
VRVSDGCRSTSHEDPLGARNRDSAGRPPRSALTLAARPRDTRWAPSSAPWIPLRRKCGTYPTRAARHPVDLHWPRFFPRRWGIAGSRRKSGKLLRSINLGRISSAAPMAYMVGGKQYVALHGMEMLTVYALH